MIRNCFLLAVVTLLLSSCNRLSLGEKINLLSLGMPKEKTIEIVGKNFELVSASKTPEGNLETYLVDNLVGYPYTLSFLNGELVEIWQDRYRSLTPNVQTQNTIVAAPYPAPGYGQFYTLVKEDAVGNRTLADQQGNQITVKKNVFDNYEVNNGKDRYTIKKDVFGNLSFNGSRGKTASMKIDNLGNHTYTDNKGNKVVYNQEVWSQSIARYGDEQLLFISLINSYLY